MDGGDCLTAYHGTTKTGLTELIPFACPHSERQEAYVYLTTQKAIALLHIWDKPYRWVKFDYAKDGHIVYLEPYPGALEVFYGGVAGSIYTCEGKFKRYAKNIVIAHSSATVAEEEYVPDALECILEYERQGLLEVHRCGAMPEPKAVQMTKGSIGIVIWLLTEESVKAALHLDDMPRKEWEKALRKNLRDKDEANFILYRGDRPMDWLKLNGLKGDTAWIGELVIHPAHRRQGVGRFAVRYAEQFARERGFTRLGIRTTKDNTAARACYEGLGYELIDQNEKLTYRKELGRNT
jgi:ribosomal protein S18 acetylase RimI-like enzyme